MRKAFKYRLYPTLQQDAAMTAMLETHRQLYNDALAERKQAWEQHQRSVSYREQSAQLKLARKTNPFLAATNFSSCQATYDGWIGHFRRSFGVLKQARRQAIPALRAATALIR